MRARTEVHRSSEECRAFLQLRVAGFGRTLALFVLAFYVFGNGVATLHPLATWRDWVSPLNVLVLVAAGICAAVCALCRVGRRTTAELELIDALGTIAPGASIGLTSVYAPPVQRPELAAVMGLWWGPFLAGALALALARDVYALRIRGRDFVIIAPEGIRVTNRRRVWLMAWREIHRVHRFKEQLVFETVAPHRRETLSLEGHDAHLQALHDAIAARARTLNLGWVETLTDILG